MLSGKLLDPAACRKSKEPEPVPHRADVSIYLCVRPAIWYLLSPKQGTAVFALLFFFARLGIDWLFRWYIPGVPIPPMWSVVLTLAFGTAIASGAVYLLLSAVQREHTALGELNHELRNTLQVLVYALPNCDAESQRHLKVAVERMTAMLRRLSRVIAVSQRRTA